MHLFAEVASRVVFFGSGTALLMALGQVLQENRERGSYFFSLFLLCAGIILFGTGLIGEGIPQRFPIALLFFVTATFTIGPLHLICYEALLDPQKIIPRKMKIHFLPAALRL